MYYPPTSSSLLCDANKGLILSWFYVQSTSSTIRVDYILGERTKYCKINTCTKRYKNYVNLAYKKHQIFKSLHLEH